MKWSNHEGRTPTQYLLCGPKRYQALVCVHHLHVVGHIIDHEHYPLSDFPIYSEVFTGHNMLTAAKQSVEQHLTLLLEK